MISKQLSQSHYHCAQRSGVGSTRQEKPEPGVMDLRNSLHKQAPFKANHIWHVRQTQFAVLLVARSRTASWEEILCSGTVEVQPCLVINRGTELRVSTPSENGVCPKNSSQKVVKQNIKTTTGLKYTSRDGEEDGGEVASFVFICGFCFHPLNWCCRGNTDHETAVDLTRQSQEMFAAVP